MWRRLSQIKKRKLEESPSSSSASETGSDIESTGKRKTTSLHYRNKCFKEADESFDSKDATDEKKANVSSKSGDAKQIRSTTSKTAECDSMESTSTDIRAELSQFNLDQSISVNQTNQANQSCSSSAIECMVDTSFSFGDNKCLIVKKEGQKKKDRNNNGFKNFQDKIRKREQHLNSSDGEKKKKNKKWLFRNYRLRQTHRHHGSKFILFDMPANRF